MNQEQLQDTVEKIEILKMQILGLQSGIRESGCHFVACYPGDDEDVDFLKEINAICIDHMVAISNWDGYGSQWVLTAPQYEQYQSWLESQD